MIKQLIKKIVEVTKSPIVGEDTTNYQDFIQCEIDDEEVSCEEMNYIGIPAPIEMPIDPWFVDSDIEIVKTEIQITHEEMLEEAARREEENNKKEFKESEDIHQEMYEIASNSWTTVGEYQGGSENFQEGPINWQSGNGMGQYR